MSCVPSPMDPCRYTDFEAAEQPLDCIFHPSQDLLAVANVDGSVQILRCTAEKTSSQVTAQEHEDSCRAVSFAHEGRWLISGSASHDIAIRDIQGQQVLARFDEAHDCAISRLHGLGGQQFASGDENGGIKVWDGRQGGAVQHFTSHSDYISDIAHQSSDASLLACSGDGCLSVADTRTGKLRGISDGDPDDELLSLAILKEGKAVITGSQTGNINIFTWGKFETYSDRFPGHPNAVDSIAKVDEDTVVTGSADGLLRVLSIHPHALVGVLGQHDDFGCEKLTLSHNKRLLASCSCEPTIRIWDTACLDESLSEQEAGAHAATDQVELKEGSDSEHGGNRKRRKMQKTRAKGSSKHSADNQQFFKDLL